MKSLLFNFKCANCNNDFLAPGLPDGVYGEFLLRSKNGEIVYMNSFEDKAFEELKVLFEKYKKEIVGINKSNEAEVFQAVFGVTCDTSPTGSVYQIGEFPVCHHCFSTKMCSWIETNPPKFTDKDIEPVTHECWNQLSTEEKRKILKKAINNYLNNEVFQ